MGRFALIGGEYQSQSPVADPESTTNWYVENIEQNGKSAAALYPFAGLGLFTTIATPGRGTFQIAYPGIPSNGRVFAVGGTYLYEVFANGTNRLIGNVGNDGAPVSMATNPLQLAICSAGRVFIYTFATSVLLPIPQANFISQGNYAPVAKIDYADGFFVAQLQNTSTWQVSALFDGTTWPPLATSGIANVYAENNVGLIVDHRYVWTFGTKRSQVYYDSGAAIFPYAAINGALIEGGMIAGASLAKLDNSVFGLGGDERGAGIVWRTSGYSLVRVSNFAVETAIQGYVAKGITITDAVGWGTQEQGHTFYYLYFPSANVTWVYDVATQLWAKRLSYKNGQYAAHLAQCHCYAFGKHLVGDWSSGNIYDQSINYLTDNGQPIRRERIAPTISAEDQWVFGDQLQIILETGLGPQPPLRDDMGNPRDPQLILSWSDDCAHTWSNDYLLNCGQAGEYRARAIQRRLGKFRNRNFRIVATDPIPWRVIDGYFEGTGFQVPSERIVKQYGKVN